MHEPRRAGGGRHRAASWPVVLGVTGGLGATGAIVGLAVGVATYPPTAWFAGVELGVPATVGGFLLALPVGAVAARRASCRPGPRAGRRGAS